MGCNCGGKRAGLKYQATYADGSKSEKVDTIAQVQTLVKGKAGASFKAVKA